MIFPHIQAEIVVQENDKTRIEVSRSFANDESITMYEISVDGGTIWYDVTADMYLDWAFATAAVETITVRLTGSVSSPITDTKSIVVKTAAEDNLFSSDDDLVQHEDDILNYVREGRSTFLDKHRLAQKVILNELDKNQIWKDDNTRYVASDIVDIQEFAEWSKYLVLRLVYEAISNATDDVFSQKAARYRDEETHAKKRACLRLDSNGDGEIDNTEQVDLTAGNLVYKW